MAASDFGAGRWRQFRDIVLPLIRTGLISAFVFSFLLSLNEFTRAFYLAGRQNTLPVVLFGRECRRLADDLHHVRRDLPRLRPVRRRDRRPSLLQAPAIGTDIADVPKAFSCLFDVSEPRRQMEPVKDMRQ